MLTNPAKTYSNREPVLKWVSLSKFVAHFEPDMFNGYTFPPYNDTQIVLHAEPLTDTSPLGKS